MTDYNSADQITPDRLANLRAFVYAGRPVANRDIRMLLDAYDALRRQLATIPERELVPV